MAKLLRMKDYLRLALALGGDLLAELEEPGGLDALAKREMYGWVPEEYQRQSRLVTVSRLLKTGDIEKIIKNNQPYFRLTGQGKGKLIRDFPILALQKKKWDKRWTLVAFDIPEKQRRIREILVQKLLDLGFGMLQRSVYISPYDLSEDLREFLVNQKLAKQTFVARTQRLLAGDERKLAIKIWKLKKLNKEYQKIIKELEKKGKRGRRLKRNLKARYLEILVRDPCLPAELLLKNWAGDKVQKLLRSP